MNEAGQDVSDLVHYFDDDQTLAREVAAAFRECVPGMIERIENALDPFDAEALGDAAHSMKGAVSHFPARELYDALVQLERARTRAEALASLDRAHDELSRLQARLELLG